MADVNHRQVLLRFAARLALFLACLLVVSEGWFRWVVPARETPYPTQDPVHKLKRFDVRGPRDGVFTSGRLAQQRSAWHVNAQGYNSDRDYLPASARSQPAIAVLGDSQVDGMYVSHAEHLARVLEDAAEGRYVVYPYGHSGYKLTAYIAVARYLADAGVNPKILVLTINRGDLAGSLTPAGKPASTQFLTVSWTGDGFEERAPRPYRTTRFRRLIRHSALVRYLVFNAHINPLPGGRRDAALGAQMKRREANADPNDPVLLGLVRYVVGQIRSALPEAKVLFVIDGDRSALYRGVAEPARLQASATIERVCTDLGCGVLDLTDTYAADWARHRRRFDYEHDVHWNPHGHRTIGTAVYDWLAANGWLRGGPP